MQDIINNVCPMHSNNHFLLHGAKRVCSQISHFDEPQEIACTEIYFCFVLSIWKVEAVENDFCEYVCAIFFSFMDLGMGFIYYYFVAVCNFYSAVHFLSLQCQSVCRK